jgi:uncharacterized protein
MNAPNPNNGELDALRRAQRAHEPSMEEILASIRAIIADDREATSAKPAPAAPRPVAPTGPQIVYSNDSPSPLRAVVEVSALPVLAEAPLHDPVEPTTPTVVWARPRVEAVPAPAPEPEPDFAPEPEPAATLADAIDASLLSEEADRAVSASFEALSASVALQSAELVERLTREMLRPMIKTWLDEHLPSMVERLVRAEIQRVARGGR